MKGVGSRAQGVGCRVGVLRRVTVMVFSEKACGVICPMARLSMSAVKDAISIGRELPGAAVIAVSPMVTGSKFPCVTSTGAPTGRMREARITTGGGSCPTWSLV